jgi:CHRD domain
MRKRWLVAGLALCAMLVLALPTAASARVKPLFAVLAGTNEIADNGMRGVGDPDGGGSFTAVIDGRRLCYGIAVKDIEDPIAAHIHKGGKNRNGPVVIPLEHPTSGDPGSSSRCVTIKAKLARAIRRHPGRYYVNIHNEEFEDGAARGQLFARSP